MFPREWLFDLAVAFVGGWLLAFPIFVAYLIHRPHERHVAWLHDQARSARDDETRAHYLEAAREYPRSGRGRLGCLFALLGAGVAFAWICYVTVHWHAIGRAMRAVTDSP
jgi:hypothetical protein